MTKQRQNFIHSFELYWKGKSEISYWHSDSFLRLWLKHLCQRLRPWALTWPALHTWDVFTSWSSQALSGCMETAGPCQVSAEIVLMSSSFPSILVTLPVPGADKNNPTAWCSCHHHCEFFRNRFSICKPQSTFKCFFSEERLWSGVLINILFWLLKCSILFMCYSLCWVSRRRGPVAPSQGSGWNRSALHLIHCRPALWLKSTLYIMGALICSALSIQ